MVKITSEASFPPVAQSINRDYKKCLSEEGPI